MSTQEEIELLRRYPKAIYHLRAQLQKQKLMPMFGAGVSNPIGLPNWSDLVQRIARHPQVMAEEVTAGVGYRSWAKVNVFLGQEQSAVQKTAWDEIVKIASRFIVADRYLFAVPMWNGTVPYRLKQYIDIIHQPGLLFGLKPETGYFGLLENKHATVVLTSGAYADRRPSPAFGVDHQFTYLKAWLNQAGVTAIDEVRFQPTLLTPDPKGAFEQAKQAAVDLARTHARV